MQNENILYTLTFGLMQQIIGFIDACQEVLFTNIIDINIGGNQLTVSLWGVLGGAGAVVLITLLVVRLFT